MEIDFNPQPQATSLDYLSQGLNSGLNLGLGFQRARLAQQENQRQQQELEMQRAAQAAKLEQEKEQLQLLKFGQLSGVYDKTKSPINRKLFYENTLRPAAKQTFGVDFPDYVEGQFDKHLGAAGELAEQHAKGLLKFDDYKKQLGLVYADALKAGEMEAATAIKDLVKFGENSGMTEYQRATLALREQEAAAKAAKVSKLSAEKPKAKASLANTLREYDNMITEAEAIKKDPGLPMATGATSFMGDLPGALSLGAKQPRARLETLKAKTLLNVLAALKDLSATGASGFGQLSNIEGENLRNSISTLDPSLETDDFKASLDRFISEMKERKQVLKSTFDSTYAEGDGVDTAGDDSEYNQDQQDAAAAIAQGLVTAEEAAKRLRQKYPQRFKKGG